MIKIITLSIILYSPYLIFSASKGFHGIGFIGGRTELLQFLEIFLLFIFILGTLMWYLFRGDYKKIAGIIMLSVLAAWLSDFPILLIIIPLILISGYGITKTVYEQHENLNFILLLIIVGSLLALFCDLFYISDAYGKPYHRMNTVLKIYLEIWIFLGIASASSIYFILKKSSLISGFKNRISISKGIWISIVVLLIISSIISPFAMALTLSSGKETLYGKPPSFDNLNGLNYLLSEHPCDLIAIDWIEKNIVGSHVMVEAPGDAFTYSSRISALTGLSTIIGWTTHESLWRGGSPELDIRRDDTDLIYNSENNTKTLELLNKYDAEYVYIGELEREKYSGLEKFDNNPEFYEQIYNDHDVSIYKVTRPN